MKYSILLILSLLLSCNQEEETTQIANNTATEILSFEVDTLDLDMISHAQTNSLFFSYSADNGYNENILKVNLDTFQETLVVHADATQCRQIEIVNDQLLSFGGYTNYSLDLDLQNISLINQEPGGFGYFRTVVANNDVYFPSGFDNYSVYSVSNNNFDYFWNASSTSRGNGDGEIVGNKLYSFGGSTGTSNYQPQSFDEINILDLTSTTWTQENMPFSAFETFTERYNNTIYVAGNKFSNHSGAFIAIYDPSDQSFTNISVPLDIQNITIRGIAILSDNLYIAYADFVTQMPNIVTIKVVQIPI